MNTKVTIAGGNGITRLQLLPARSDQEQSLLILSI